MFLISPFFVEEKGLILIGHLLPITSLNSQCSSFFHVWMKKKLYLLGLPYGSDYAQVQGLAIKL